MFEKNFEELLLMVWNFMMTNHYFHWMLVTIAVYFFFAYLIKKIYKRDKKKRDISIFHLKVILYTILVAFILEMFGVHKAWIIRIITGISALLFVYNIGSWFIFNKYSTKSESKNIVKDEALLAELKKHKTNDGVFTFNSQKYEVVGEKYYKLVNAAKSNKDTRLYDMFLVLVLFFFALLGMSMLLDNVILKDSMSSNVILLFGAAFVLPYLQDIKHTIRFANNPHLKFDGYVGFWINGKEVFGKIVDMNTYEIILFRRFSKSYVTISHSEIKTFTSYESGRLFTKKYIVSKAIKYKLEEAFGKWLEEFNELYKCLDEDKNEVGVLDLKSFDIFFTTEDDDHGIELNVFVRKEALEQYKYYIKKLEDFIQRKADENDWSLETPRRVDIKVLEQKEK